VMPNHSPRQVAKPTMGARISLSILAGSVALSALVLVPAWARERQAWHAWQAVRKTNPNDVPSPLPENALPAAADTPDESARFLAAMERLARASGCRLTRWEGVPTAAPDPRALLIKDRVVAETTGDFASQQAFARAIARSPRRLACAKFEIQRPDDRPGILLARWEIERYVRREPVGETPSALAPPGARGDGAPSRP